MAFRRFRRRFPSRRFRRSPWDVQRFHICRGVFSVGGPNCDSAVSSSVQLVLPSSIAGPAGTSILPAQLSSIDKGLVFGGAKFWCEWVLNLNTLPAEYFGLMFNVSMVAWLAKVPLDPSNGAPAYIPDPFQVTIQGDRQWDFLWTRLWEVPIASVTPGTTFLVSSTGGQASINAGVFGATFTSNDGARYPYRVKTKRRLTEEECILFGVSAVTGVETTSTLPFVFDIFGQCALKRAR